MPKDMKVPDGPTQLAHARKIEQEHAQLHAEFIRLGAFFTEGKRGACLFCSRTQSSYSCQLGLVTAFFTGIRGGH